MNFKKLIALFCFILFFSIIVNHESAHASNSYPTIISKNVNSEKIVNVEGGLIMREAPNSQGKKVTMLKDGSKVFVYSTDENGWSYVKQGEFKGYVKDSYLTTKSQTLSNSNNNKVTKTRVIDFSMSVNQVKKMEPAKLINEMKDDNFTILEYEVEKYGFQSLLQYYFVNGKLDMIVYDFLPDRDSYNSWSEMSVMFDRLDTKAVKEFGEGVFVSDKYSYFARMWDKDGYNIMLRVNDDNLYTEAVLVFLKK